MRVLFRGVGEGGLAGRDFFPQPGQALFECLNVGIRGSFGNLFHNVSRSDFGAVEVGLVLLPECFEGLLRDDHADVRFPRQRQSDFLAKRRSRVAERFQHLVRVETFPLDELLDSGDVLVDEQFAGRQLTALQKLLQQRPIDEHLDVTLADGVARLFRDASREEQKFQVAIGHFLTVDRDKDLRHGR